MLYQAHRGVSCEYPENTMAAFLAAADQGFQIIELDLEVTRDQQVVVLHDKTINRTARDAQGQPPAEPLLLEEMTYEEAARYDYGLHKGEPFRGTQLPLFSQVLALARERGLRLKIDNKYQRFSDARRQVLFDLIRPYTDVACLTCSNLEALAEAVKAFPDMHFHYDGPVTEEILAQLGALLPRQRLTVWLPHRNPDTAWVKVAFADATLAAMVKKYASLGIWILATEAQLQEAAALGADVIETHGQLKPKEENQ